MSMMLHDLYPWLRDNPKTAGVAVKFGGVSGSLPIMINPAPPTGKVRAGLIGPSLLQGGAETHQLSVAKSTREAIEWMGCVATMPHLVDPEMLADTQAIMPVGVGEGNIRKLAENADVLLTWANLDFKNLLKGLENPPKVVFCQHLPDGEHPRRGVDKYVAVSECTKLATPKKSREATPIIANAVDPSRVIPTRSREEVRESWGVPIEAKVVGYLGRLAEEKEPDACRRLALALPDGWHVVVVGDGQLKNSLEGDIANLHVVGPDKDVGSVLHAFDRLLVPSLYESFCYTIAEGWLAGVPVISTEVGIAKQNPTLSRLIPFRAEGPVIAQAVMDEEGVEARVEAARSWVSDSLSIERFGREWTELLGGEAGVLPAIRACPFRTAAPCGCSSEPARCSLGKGYKGMVWFPDCESCVGSKA